MIDGRLPILNGDPNPPSLGDILRVQAAIRPEAIAIRFEGEAIGYGELARRACGVANALIADGVKPGDRIAILSKNHSTFFEILFGAAIAGVVVVPINWRLSAAELIYLVEDSECRTLFVGGAFCDLGREISASASADPSVVVIDGPDADFSAWRNGTSAVDPRLPVDPREIALQLYTSGTTGRPKGAQLSHHALNSVRVSQPKEADWANWTSDDVCLISMPLFHVGGIGTALASLYHGATMVIARDFAAGAVFDYLERDGITKLFMVPTAMRIVLDHPRSRVTDYSRLKYILYGSMPIAPALLAEVLAVFRCGLVQVYGMTETSGTVTALPPEDHVPDGSERMRSVGKALVGVEIRILDADGTVLPAEAMGEIALRSAATMTSYWKLPEATASVMTDDGFLRTGDAGYLDEDGYLFVIDRVKDMIISGGENIYCAEVELALAEHLAVADVAVIGVPDEKWGEVVKAVVVPAAGAKPDPDELRNWVRERLAGYKVPKTIDFSASLPKNSAGKTLRRELRTRYGAN